MRGKTTSKVLGAALCLLFLAATAAADVKLPGVFGDHMVLQREIPVPVWGTARTRREGDRDVVRPDEDRHYWQ